MVKPKHKIVGRQQVSTDPLARYDGHEHSTVASAIHSIYATARAKALEVSR